MTINMLPPRGLLLAARRSTVLVALLALTLSAQ